MDKILLGGLIGFVAAVGQNLITSFFQNKKEKNKLFTEKLEELLELSEIENKESLISVSLHSENNITKQIDILKNILSNNFENHKIIENSEKNYAK